MHLTVSDTGIGMDEATQARIFEPFFTTKEMGKGTGLGLAVVFGIVKQSGGQVAVTSIVGRGTTFTIYFPRLSSPEASATAPEPRIVPGGGSETILVVEDEEQVRTLACAVLRREGYHVLDAASGGDALLACEQHAEPIHLLLTDVVLPRISGERLSERLTDLRPSMKVLYMSGHSDDSISARTAGGQPPAFLPKPLTRESLLRKVREVLDGVVGTPSRDLKARRESALRLERRRSRTGPFERYPQDPL